MKSDSFIPIWMKVYLTQHPAVAQQSQSPPKRREKAMRIAGVEQEASKHDDNNDTIVIWVRKNQACGKTQDCGVYGENCNQVRGCRRRWEAGQIGTDRRPERQ